MARLLLLRGSIPCSHDDQSGHYDHNELFTRPDYVDFRISYLIHSNSILRSSYCTRSTSTYQCRDWYANSRLRILLYDCCRF